MFGLEKYAAPATCEQAWQLLNKNRNNVILGGLLWMKTGKKSYHTGIDLKNLMLDRIIETNGSIEIGAMTSLRQMETDKTLANYFGTLFQKALGPIVGIQFRNLATLGGSVYSRFGFSDVITALLCLDTTVHLHKAGALPLEAFLSRPVKKDIIIKVAIKKQRTDTSYQSIRKSATNFPILSLAAARHKCDWTISVGARPGRACRAVETASALPENPGGGNIDQACKALMNETAFGTDQRGSKAYRSAMSAILLKRGIIQICR